ncbi:MAG: HAD hydrolase-like protein [Synergistaceae bacterium]
MKRYQTILFDFDGTLADTSEGIFNCVRFTQEKMKLREISLEEYLSFVGPPMEESYSRVFALSACDSKRAVSFHKQYGVENGAFEVSLYGSIKKLLKLLREQNRQIGVATLKFQKTTEKIISFLSMSDLFDVVKGSEGIQEETKSSIIDACLHGLPTGTDYESVLVGDSKYDAIGAAEVGIDFIAVTYGFGFKTKEEAQQYDSVFIAESVDDLISFFGERC